MFNWDKICSNCNTKMIDNCDVSSYIGYGVFISKKGKGLFNKSSESVKTCVCSNCGTVGFYIENFNEFKRFIN